MQRCTRSTTHPIIIRQIQPRSGSWNQPTLSCNKILTFRPHNSRIFPPLCYSLMRPWNTSKQEVEQSRGRPNEGFHSFIEQQVHLNYWRGQTTLLSPIRVKVQETFISWINAFKWDADWFNLKEDNVILIIFAPWMTESQLRLLLTSANMYLCSYNYSERLFHFSTITYKQNNSVESSPSHTSSYP